MIEQLLKSGLGQQLISGTGGKLGLDSKTTSSVVEMALPLLLSALDKNTNTTAGAQALDNALASKHDGYILDNLSEFLQGSDFSDGAGVLNHILGNNQDKVVSQLSSKTGVDTSNITEIMKMAAPVVLGMLGKEKRNNSLDATGIASLLSNFTGATKNQNPNEMSFVEQLLDQDNDGSVMDDVASIGMNLLNGFFKK